MTQNVLTSLAYTPAIIDANDDMALGALEALCTSPKKTDTEIWLTVTVCGLIRTLHFVQGRNPA